MAQDKKVAMSRSTLNVKNISWQGKLIGMYLQLADDAQKSREIRCL